MEMVPAQLLPVPSVASCAALSEDRSTEVSTLEITVCDPIAVVGPPLGRQTTVGRSCVGGSTASLPSVGSDMLEIRPVSSCPFHDYTLRLIPVVKRLGFLKHQICRPPWLEQTT